jgi:hypothetical protein
MFRLKFYLGEIAMGTPHFLPRKWVKLTEQDCIDKAEKMNAKLDKKVVSQIVDKFISELIERSIIFFQSYRPITGYFHLIHLSSA